MSTSNVPGAAGVWAAIESEKRRDRFVRRVAIAAWSVTFALLIILGVFAGLAVAEMVHATMLGQLPWMSAYSALLPFAVICGVVFVLVATLATVGVFLRMRTTTMHEVQARLAALEQMLTSRGDA